MDKHLGLSIIRLQTGLDFSKYGQVSDLEEKKHNAFYNPSFVNVEFNNINNDELKQNIKMTIFGRQILSN